MTGKGSFVRWQSVTLTQLGNSLNVILTLSTASLGFAFASVNRGSFELGEARVPFTASLVLLLGSIVCGILCSLNRLCDFRKTAQIARRREKLFREDYELQKERQKAEELGQRTWRLFCWQVGLFAVGETLLALALAITYRCKLL